MCKCSYERSGCCTLRPTLTECPVPDTPYICRYENRVDWEQLYYDERDRYDRLVSFELDEAAELAKLKRDTQNVVIITFPDCKKKYLYSLPERINLRKGRKVFLSGTDDIGTVYRDSFRIGGDALAALVDVMGATLPLAPVIGMRFGDE